MKLTACITVNDRSVKDLTKVFESIKNEAFDELVIVEDKPPVEISELILDYWFGDDRVKNILAPDRPKGWVSPVRAWNAGFKAVSGDIIYCFSSETVQSSGNMEEALRIFWPGESSRFTEPEKVAVHGKAECSCGPRGKEVHWTDGTPGNLLGDSKHPRPLGFIWAAPMAYIKKIGGYDEGFADGFWYDDNDFFLRLWRTGLDFLFTDYISGVHLHHARPVLETPEGLAGIQRNTNYMMKKHGYLHPWEHIIKLTEKSQGKTIWRHI